MAWHELFDAFHRRIRLDADSGELLREKREILIKKVQAAAPVKLDWFNQGSYAMATGLKPYPGKQQDIDLGLIFALDIAGTDAPLPKSWVYSALARHTKLPTEWRKHCITVYYSAARGTLPFHVDLAVYGLDRRGRLHLAVGRERSRDENCGWLHSDPKELVKVVKGHLHGEEQAQFRRIVRYLKRWRDHRWGPAGAGAPPGIALTVLALANFQPHRGEDRIALLAIVEAVLRFSGWWRIRAPLPVAPRNDTLAGLTDAQMVTFTKRLGALRDALAGAGMQAKPAVCRALVGQFGGEFSGGAR